MKISLMLLVFTTYGCASVSTIKSAEPIPPIKCEVSVHSSLETARSKGEIEELCIISGTSSGSFSHTVATAIEKHKNKACSCGGTEVYIQVQDAGTLGTASVTLVAFRYTLNERKFDSSSKDDGMNLQREKARKCQAKGGLWFEGKCEIDID